MCMRDCRQFDTVCACMCLGVHLHVRMRMHAYSQWFRVGAVEPSRAGARAGRQNSVPDCTFHPGVGPVSVLNFSSPGLGGRRRSERSDDSSVSVRGGGGTERSPGATERKSITRSLPLTQISFLHLEPFRRRTTPLRFELRTSFPSLDTTLRSFRLCPSSGAKTRLIITRVTWGE